MGAHLSQLSESIAVKEGLIEQIRLQQEQYEEMENFYNGKLAEMEHQLCQRELERNDLAQELEIQTKDSTNYSTVKLALDAKEKHISELRRKQIILKKLINVSSRNESAINRYKQDVTLMKKQKVELVKKIAADRKVNLEQIRRLKKDAMQQEREASKWKRKSEQARAKAEAADRVAKSRSEEIGNLRLKYRDAEKALRIRTLKRGMMERAGLDSVMVGRKDSRNRSLARAAKAEVEATRRRRSRATWVPFVLALTLTVLQQRAARALPCFAAPVSKYNRWTTTTPPRSGRRWGALMDTDIDTVTDIITDTDTDTETALVGYNGLSALKRAAEVASVLVGSVAAPILADLLLVAASDGDDSWPDDWEAFWSSSSSTGNSKYTHARRLSLALETLGPTYVKFGQALGSRPDVIPVSLAGALASLQDDMEPFDTETARRIVRTELEAQLEDRNMKKQQRADHTHAAQEEEQPNNSEQNFTLEALLSSMSSVPVAAASVGQVYKARLPAGGQGGLELDQYLDVAVKVQRPGVRILVERDAELLLAVATFLESLPALPGTTAGTTSAATTGTDGGPRLINTRLVSATKEFMSRIFEELDYRREAENVRTFARLYSDRGRNNNDDGGNGKGKGKRKGGRSKRAGDVSVVVPEVYMDWCTENVLVMEWIEGTKLTDVRPKVETTDVDGSGGGGNEGEADDYDAATVKENLELVKVAIDSTLSQLLDTGVLHADPHAGNLLKVRSPGEDGKDGSVTLGYLDFGLLSTIPQEVRDALVCAVALQVFSRDVDAVSRLFVELRLIPAEVLADDGERAALAEALERTFENSLIYTAANGGSGGDNGDASATAPTTIPELKFDKLLDSLSRLVPRFRFDLPPYFINNARALSTLEGIAKSLDPSFNVLAVMYPYALNRMLRNPSGSPVVAKTLQGLIRSEDTGRVDRTKIVRLLRDSAAITGVRKRRVVWDVARTREGRRLVQDIVLEEAGYLVTGRLSRSAPKKRTKGRKRRWYYFEL